MIANTKIKSENNYKKLYKAACASKTKNVLETRIRLSDFEYVGIPISYVESNLKLDKYTLKDLRNLLTKYYKKPKKEYKPKVKKEKVAKPKLSDKQKEYKQYLKSPQWKKKRLEIIMRDNFTCRKCGIGVTPSMAEVHHLTYQRIFKELPSDLITLCRNCHMKEHELA